MDIKNYTLGSDAVNCREVLASFLEGYLSPAFSALPKKEIDLLVMNALEKIDYINHDPSLYELVQKLRVTRMKARNLIYDQELRRLNTAKLDQRVKDALLHPILQKDGELFLLEIENPLVSDHLRSKIQKLEFISDSSFSPSIVKLPLNAIVAVIEDYLSEEERKNVKKALVKAGAPDISLQGVLKSTLKIAAKKLASDTGEALVESVSEYLSPILDNAVDTAMVIFTDLFEKEK